MGRIYWTIELVVMCYDLTIQHLFLSYHLTASRHVHSLYPVSIKASSFGKPPLSPSGRCEYFL